MTNSKMTDSNSTSSNDTRLVRYEADDGIATITLDSPHNRNALSHQLLSELGAAVECAIADDTLRAAVIQATGPAFCAGADLKERSSKQPSGNGNGNSNGVPHVMERIMECDLPFVARVQGAVRAGGTGIVAACDIALADSSVSFAIPEVKLGLVPAVISVPIARVIDARSLHRYFLTGEPFSAAEAARIGLISEACDDLDASVQSVTAHLRQAHPGALRRTKTWLGQISMLDVNRGFELASEMSLRWFATPDAQEGIRAVLEKREPAWR